MEYEDDVNVHAKRLIEDANHAITHGSWGAFIWNAAIHMKNISAIIDKNIEGEYE